MFMLDTDICIYIKKHKPPQMLKKFQTLSPTEVCMSAITFAELMNGALKYRSISFQVFINSKIPPNPPLRKWGIPSKFGSSPFDKGGLGRDFYRFKIPVYLCFTT